MTLFPVLTLAALLQIPTAIASFDGVFKSSDKKFVYIQVESGETMRMYITRGTKFIRSGRPAKASDFHNGDKVTADGERDLRQNLLAVKVEAVQPDVAKPEGSKP